MIGIDLGSNTLRIILYDCQKRHPLKYFEKSVKTADGLATHHKINTRALQRIIEALKEAQRTINFSSHRIYAVTTEAMRQASNSQEVLATIKAHTGVSFRIISPKEEAHLTLKAVKYRLQHLQYQQDRVMLVDIGGGSTEVTFSYGTTIITQSFPIGIVTIAQRYQTLEAIKTVLPTKMQAIEAFIKETLATYGEIQSFIATAGTPTTLAAMKLKQTYATYDATKINGTTLYQEELDHFLAELLAMPYKRREVLVGEGRSDLILAGIAIFQSIYRFIAKAYCIVIDDGLREGVVLEACNTPPH